MNTCTDIQSIHRVAGCFFAMDRNDFMELVKGDKAITVGIKQFKRDLKLSPIEVLK